RVTMQLRGGSLGVHLNGPSGGWAIGQEMGELGPPFKEGRMQPSLYPARTEDGPSRAALTPLAPSVESPGLVVQRTLSVAAGDLVRIDYRVVNTTGSSLPAKLRIVSFPGMGGTLVQPGPSGLIREPLRGWGHYPEGETDPLDQGASFAESWNACEDDGKA